MRRNATTRHLGFTLVIDGEVYGTELSLSEARFIAGEAWEDKARTQVWQNGANHLPMKAINHAGATII